VEIEKAEGRELRVHSEAGMQPTTQPPKDLAAESSDADKQSRTVRDLARRQLQGSRRRARRLRNCGRNGCGGDRLRPIFRRCRAASVRRIAIGEMVDELPAVGKPRLRVLRERPRNGGTISRRKGRKIGRTVEMLRRELCGGAAPERRR